MSSEGAILFTYIGLSLGSVLFTAVLSIAVAGVVFRMFSGMLNSQGEVATWTSSFVTGVLAAIAAFAGTFLVSTQLRSVFGAYGALVLMLGLTFAAYIGSTKLALRFEDGSRLSWPQSVAIGAAASILILILRVITR